LWPGGPAPDDDRWATGNLTEGEVALWRRMSGADRRHAVGVARRVEATLGDEVTRPVLAAALLHDVGKVESGFGPVRRSLATVVGWVAGRERAAGWDNRTGRYLTHDALGATLLADAGADPLTVTWAREHHLSPDRWTVPKPFATALKDADDD
jgi:hypothetical protein